MRLDRLVLILATVAVAMPTAPASRVAATAPILSEVQKHLDDAQKCFDNGTYDLALAHADMVLVDSELTYAVQFQNVPEAIKPNAEKALGQALKTWEESLPNDLKFKRIEDAAQADVLLRFKPDVRMGREPVAGYATWKRVINRDENGKVNAKFTSDLQIRTMTLAWKAMPMEAMRHEIMHEVGHVLGLEDCDDTTSIMGPLDISKPVHKPRPHEVRAVFELRTQANRIRREAAAQRIKD